MLHYREYKPVVRIHFHENEGTGILPLFSPNTFRAHSVLQPLTVFVSFIQVLVLICDTNMITILYPVTRS